MDCERLEQLAPELALGIADGADRAEALRHLADCAECRRLVERLSEVGDELITMAPVQEPPAGFETEVLGRLDVRPSRRRRGRAIALRVGPPVAAAVAAAAIAVVATVAVHEDDREVADLYRENLERADGSYFGSRELVDSAGDRAGTAFIYEGDPSWVLVVVDEARRKGIAGAELVDRNGAKIPIAGFSLDPEQGSWGGVIPIPLKEAVSIRLRGDEPGEVLRGEVPLPDD